MANDAQKWLNWYKNDGYLQINPYLKYSKLPNDRTVETMNKFKNSLTSAMKTKKEQGIDKDIILYRGHRGRTGIDDLFKYGNGTFIEKSFSSTSLIPLIQFGRKQMRIKLPDNIKFYIYSNNSENGSAEYEYLLESGLVYTLKNITKVRLIDLVPENIQIKIRKTGRWKNVTEDTMIEIYDCDIEPYIPGKVLPYIPLIQKYKPLSWSQFYLHLIILI
jgi:hypothetical protein